MIPPLIVEAHRLITTTATPTKDVAALVGLTPRSLEKRLRRIYGTTARGLRTGAPLTPGRPPSLREEWRVRLTAEERARVDAAIVVGYAAGARSEGEALAMVLTRAQPLTSIAENLPLGWLAAVHPPRHGVPWSAEENADLRAAWGAMAPAALAIRHGRKENAIMAQAMKLSLTCTCYPQDR